MGPVRKSIPLLYGFSFFDQFMIVIALLGPLSRDAGHLSKGVLKENP